MKTFYHFNRQFNSNPLICEQILIYKFKVLYASFYTNAFQHKTYEQGLQLFGQYSGTGNKCY